MNSSRITHAFRSWLPLAIAVTGICGLVHVAVQQNYRMSLNDPQIQIAEDAAQNLARGADPASLVPTNQLNIAVSLAPYIIIYDKDGKPLVSSATLDGSTPVPPAGVFAFATQHGEDRVTWQPRSDVRTAIVVRPYMSAAQSGFVLAGRGMREVEIRESNLGYMVGGMWITILLITFIAALLVG